MVQTFGDRANFHPHVHALVTRGGWNACGGWVPVPYVDEGSAEELFRHKVLGMLHRWGLLSLERIELLLSWKRSGFSVHNRVYAHPHLRTRPYRPCTNGKAERFIQTLLREWAYARPYTSSRKRAQRLPRWLNYHNHRRPHGGIKGQAPISRILSQGEQRA